MNKKNNRILFLGGSFAAAAVAIGLVLTALNSSISYFYLPEDLAAVDEKPTRSIRLGGLVAKDSVEFAKGNDASVSFYIEDAIARIPVTYNGILPDLFREGQGVIAQGTLDTNGRLIATQVLAKHDETYMPREVAERLKEQGIWQGEQP